MDDRQYLNDEQEWVCRCGSTTEFLTEVEACGVQAEYPLEDCVFPCPFEFEEDSPRGFAGGERLAGQGRIAVAQSLGLAGQIVINAANVHDYPDCGGFDHVDARSFWTGFVQVPPVSAGAPIILGPLTTTPGGVCCFSRQPVHAVAVEAYGGGDVGEVPFRIHYQSSSPSYMRSCSDAVAAAIFAVELADAADIEEPAITVRYDGPITFEASDDPPTPPSGRNIGVVDRWTGSEWIEALDLFAVALSTSNNREVLITPLNTDPAVYAASAQSVNFRFRPVRGDELDGNSAPIPYDSRLICHPGALLVTEGTVPVSSEMYHFTVMGEPGTPGPCDELLGDYNQDEIVDLTDLIDFLADWNPHLGQSVTPGTNGDFNGDGVVDLADLIEFLGYWNPQLGCPY
ncbi:MAG: hypothetical protein KF768_09470 [Phycisphaeraceae bacterium]|nr:hypothetical protein [Phycisphaeraceae bacterium]